MANVNFVERSRNDLAMIILPRSIALECQLNDTLADLNNMTSADLLYGAGLYYTNDCLSTSSSHIIMAISKNLTGEQADALIYLLTHNSTEARIGNNVTISSTSSLYLLHLPNDVLSAVPSFIDNAGLGNMPDYWSLGEVLSDIADFLFDSLVFIVTGGFLFLWMHMVEEGLEMLCELASDAAVVVKGAVDAIVDAFNWYMSWILKLIETQIQIYLSPFIKPIQEGMQEYSGGINNSIASAECEYNSTGHVSSSTKFELLNALNSKFFYILLVLALAIDACILAIDLLTGGIGFIFFMTFNVVVSFVVFNIVGSVDQQMRGSYNLPGLDCSSILGWIESSIGGEYPSSTAVAAGVVAAMIDVVGLFFGLGIFTCEGVKS